jgi:hypothetical protein
MVYRYINISTIDNSYLRYSYQLSAFETGEWTILDHLVVRQELLGRNLYELITEHNGLLSIQLVQQATYQVLLALAYLKLGS